MYLDNLDASNTAYNNATTGLGSGDVQSAIDALSSRVASGINNYNIVSSTSFASSASSDTLIPGMTVTPSSGTYAIFFNGEMTGSGSGTALSVTIYKAGIAISDSLRKTVSPSGTHEFTSSSQTISQFNGTQSCDVRINPNGSSTTSNQRSLVLIRLGP